MTHGESALPKDEVLRNALSSLLMPKNAPGADFLLKSRVPNAYTSSFMAEIVTCQVLGQERYLLCKYSILTHRQNDLHTNGGQRGGPAYEAIVYEKVLSNLDISLPRYYGRLDFKDQNQFAIIIEYIDNAYRLCDEDQLIAAAGWLGSFHKITEGKFTSSSLTHFDRHYFESWGYRAAEYAAPLRDQYPWFDQFCSFWKDHVVDKLLMGQSAVLHAEFYPQNILLSQGQIFPIDWESAAIGNGLIDLASLIEGWTEDVMLKCLQRYAESRWSAYDLDGLQELLKVAKIYWQIRWLGDRPSWTELPSLAPRFDALYELACDQGVFSGKSDST